jgi:hypothetical protein
VSLGESARYGVMKGWHSEEAEAGAGGWLAEMRTGKGG